MKQAPPLPHAPADLGTYRFGEFQDNAAELDRLVAQATVGWNIERHVLDRRGIRRATDILDLACGPGAVTLKMTELAPDAKITGVDLNPTLLDRAKRDGFRHGSKTRFVQADCHRLPFEDDCFDFVYARFLFQHLADPVTALSEARRVLRPGGSLLVVDVDDRDLRIDPPLAEFDEFTRMASIFQARNGGDRHIGRRLPDLMKSCGFQSIQGGRLEVTSDDIGLENCWNITTRFKLELMPPERHHAIRQRLDAMLLEICEQRSRITAGVHEVMGAA